MQRADRVKNMQYDAFISYRHADGDAARGVAKLLRAFNLKVYIDDGIAAGAEWAPEIWSALEVSKTLMVLWSRSASQSPHVHEEWTRAPAGCNVFALALDGQTLPPELGKFNAITGLDVAGRLLARSVELMKSEKLSPAKAQERLLAELAKDGIVLEEKQKRALAGLLPLFAVTSWWLPAWLTTAAPLSAGGAAVFAAGYWLAQPSIQPDFHRALPAPEVASAHTTEPAPSPTIPVNTSSSTCPNCDQEALAHKTCAAELGTCNEAKTGSDARAATLTGELKRCQAAAPSAGSPSSKPSSRVPPTTTTPGTSSPTSKPPILSPLSTVFLPKSLPTAAPANTLR